MNETDAYTHTSLLAYRPKVRFYNMNIEPNNPRRVLPPFKLQRIRDPLVEKGFRFMFTCFWRKLHFSKDPPLLVYYEKNPNNPILRVGHPSGPLEQNSVCYGHIRAMKEDLPDGDTIHPCPVLVWSALEEGMPWWTLPQFVELRLAT